jgi:hypothetical protein
MRETPGARQPSRDGAGARTFGAAVGVDGPDQDELGDGVRDVAEDAEDVEAHGDRRARRSTRAVAVSRRGAQHASAGAGGQVQRGESPAAGWRW